MTSTKFSISATLNVLLLAGLALAMQQLAAEKKRSEALQAESRDLAAVSAQVAAARPAAKPSAEQAAAASSGDGEAASPEGKPEKKEKNPMAEMMKGLGKLMSSKEAQAGMREMTKGMVKSQFADLFEVLQLDEAQQAALTELLSTAEADQQAAGMSFFSGKTPEELKTLTEEMVAKQKATDDQAKQLLGDAKYADYKRFQDSKPERDQLDMLRGSLKSDGHPLSDDQEQQVLDTLYRERKAYPWKLDYSNDREWAVEKMDTARMEEFAQQQEAYDAHVQGKLGGILSPEQMNGFKTVGEQRRGMTKLGITMMSGLLNQGDK